jgi:hypothetical protein
MPSALHPQTILALDFLGAPRTVPFGAPVRLRIPTARLQESEIHCRHRRHQRLPGRLLGGSGLQLVQRVLEKARERAAGHPQPHLDSTLKLQDRKEAHS